MNLKGQCVDVTLKNGFIYEGIFHTTSTEKDLNLVLKWARRKNVSLTSSNQPIENLIISYKDLAYINAQDISFTNEKEIDKTFTTDSNITKTKEIKEKELVPWVPSADEQLLNSEDLDSASGKWDQFEVNSKKFGVTSTYRESLYTTELDKDSEFYKKKLKIAERIADEIEKQTSTNVQVQIDRNQNTDDFTEEELYSSVIRKTGKLDIPIVRTRSNSLRSPSRRESTMENMKKQIQSDRNRSLTIGTPNLMMSKFNHSNALAALDLNPVTPKVSDDILKKFLEFQANKKKSKQSEIKEIKEFNQTIKAKSINEMKSQIKKDPMKIIEKETLNVNAKEFNPSNFGKKTVITQNIQTTPIVDMKIPINEVYCNNFPSRPKNLIDWNIPIPENYAFMNRV